MLMMQPPLHSPCSRRRLRVEQVAALVIFAQIGLSSSLLPLALTTNRWWPTTTKITSSPFIKRNVPEKNIINTNVNDRRAAISPPSTPNDLLKMPPSFAAVRDDERVPFVIQQVGKFKEKEIREISEMCINVFFNDGEEKVQGGDNFGVGKFSLPVKSMHMNYLRNLQFGDLRTRIRGLTGLKNVMFVARRVVPTARQQLPRRRFRNSNSIRTNQVMNAKSLPLMAHRNGINGNMDPDNCATSDILGFVEVTFRPFGLGMGNDITETGKVKLRPVLANLAVKKDARESGVGSCLMDACEEAVLDCDPACNEMILQVEEDNPKAKRFYEKRGYQMMFSDPTARRFDVNGMMLKKVRATKLCMRKSLASKRLLWQQRNANLENNRKSNRETSPFMGGLAGPGKWLQAFKESIPVVAGK